MVEDERPRSTAASELGLLRQRHTVSGLRYTILYSMSLAIRIILDAHLNLFYFIFSEFILCFFFIITKSVNFHSL